MKALALLAALAWAAPQAPAPESGAPAGVLVMAHGGDEAWNRAVHEAVAPLERRVPVELAFGMADADTLDAAVGRLEARGVRRISVVRLFVSGDSFLKRTRKILGLDPGAPPKPLKPSAPAGGYAHHASRHPRPGGRHPRPGGRHPRPGGRHGAAMFHDPDTMPLWRVKSRSRIVIDPQGLLDSELSGRILAERAAALSKDPANESVLILAHGAGDEAENARLHERMERFSALIRQSRPFREVRVETLREDWPDKRKEAESRIRAYVSAASKTGDALVVPYRIFGFGPYASTLEGLAFVSDGRGLVPHPLVGRWLLERVSESFKQAGWSDAL